MLTAGYVDVNQKYEYVLYLYIVMGLFGLGNYLALSPNDLTLIRINAFATVILFRFAFHECGSLPAWLVSSPPRLEPFCISKHKRLCMPQFGESRVLDCI